MKESSFFTSALLIAFIVLKLTNVIDWSWWWVLSPFWIPCVIGLTGLLLLLYVNGKKKDLPSKSTKSKWQERIEKFQKQREHK